MTEANITKETILSGNIPRHIAIIMDGNGRWAKERNMPRTMGHKRGAETLRDIVKSAGSIGVEAVTAYAFSTENWKRPDYEVNFLMNLLDVYLSGELEKLNKHQVKVIFSGELAQLPKTVRARAEKTVVATSANTGLVLNLAVNYGSQAEILRAVKSVASDVADNKLALSDIDETIFEKRLYTKDLPPLDLLIRPGGDLRISNFLLWQLAYAEIWFCQDYWPDITPDHLYRAIYDFQKRERRFGAIVDTKSQANIYE